MTLDPRERKSWQGFLDLLQPPAGYRLSAALGTSFGLSIDALTAALLTMSDTDGEALAGGAGCGGDGYHPPAQQGRVLVHPGRSPVVPTQALDDSWRCSTAWSSRSRLTPACSIRRCGRFGSTGSSARLRRCPRHGGGWLSPAATCRRRRPLNSAPYSRHLWHQVVMQHLRLRSTWAAALQAWMSTGNVRVPEVVWQLPRFVRRLALDIPYEARDGLRLRWQGPERKPLATFVPARLERALIVSPFVRPDFVSALVERTRHLQLVSTPEALDALDDATHARLDARREAQGSPVAVPGQRTHRPGRIPQMATSKASTPSCC